MVGGRAEAEGAGERGRVAVDHEPDGESDLAGRGCGSAAGQRDADRHRRRVQRAGGGFESDNPGAVHHGAVAEDGVFEVLPTFGAGGLVLFRDGGRRRQAQNQNGSQG